MKGIRGIAHILIPSTVKFQSVHRVVLVMEMRMSKRKSKRAIAYRREPKERQAKKRLHFERDPNFVREPGWYADSPPVMDLANPESREATTDGGTGNTDPGTLGPMGGGRRR